MFDLGRNVASIGHDAKPVVSRAIASAIEWRCVAGRAAAIVLLTLHLCAVGCARRPVIAELYGETMGTTWSAKLTEPPSPNLETIERGIRAELDRIVAQMSTWEPTSDISRYNRADADTWHDLPPELYAVLEHALELARDTGGAYDPTVGPLVNLWGFGPDGERREPPDDGAIAAIRERVGWQRVELDPIGRRVYQPGGTYLDLSSIAKGYGVDRMAAYLDGIGIDSYLVEIGGELRARGRKPDGTRWRVAVETPVPDADGVAEVLELDDLSVATSGDYRIHFESNGKRYSHTIDPRTARPVDHRLASVTVVHRDCMQADALATALTVLGPDEGMAFARERNLAVLFIERANDEFIERTTPAFDAAIRHR